MESRERFHKLMNFEPVDRLPLVEWAGWWDKTLDRWYEEGLPDGLRDRYEICQYFGLDIYYQEWFRSIHWKCPEPESHGAGILRDETDYDNLHHHFFQILDDWPVSPERTIEIAKKQETGKCVFWFTLDGFFWLPRRFFGIENHLFAFYDQADLMHRMNRENAAWMLEIIDRLCRYCQPDFMTFAEDMSYNNGPMLSRELFDEFMKPYYDVVIPELKKRGIRVFIDSDGDVTKAADWFADAGIEGILPLERQAGVDLSKIRQENPEMRFVGHFDKMVMNQGENAMRREFERLMPIARQGGFVISCDHQTPPGVSLHDYQLYLKLFREYAVVGSEIR